MLAFFKLAAVSVNRQRTFRTVVAAHLLAVGIIFLGMMGRRCGPLTLGNVLLIAGIIEGALLIGWRLSQMPKSQALEFLLVSALRPSGVLLSEAAVGLTMLVFVTLAGLPILVLMVLHGMLYIEDVPVLLVVPLVLGAVTGLGLTTWAYESQRVRWWGEKAIIAGILVYLLVGVLAGEHLADWLSGLPGGWGGAIVKWLRALHDYNPFGVMQLAMECPPPWAWGRLSWMLSIDLVLIVVLLARSAMRLKGHFHDEHYRPIATKKGERRTPVGEAPLTWWAVKRVTRYAGQINVWLAGGFGILYALYNVAEPYWPDWMGRIVFQLFDQVGGLPMMATVLMMLATVPAAFQYGLWDSNTHDRSRRLELLLLTRLDGLAYWRAALTAAWRRSRGYFVLAILMWLAAAVAGRISWSQALAGLTAGIILWGFYFTLGFRAFSRGVQGNRLGTILTMLLPLATYLLAKSDWPMLAVILPPGSVYFGTTGAANAWWMIGPVLAGLATLLLARQALERCDAELRLWYDRHHGVTAAE